MGDVVDLRKRAKPVPKLSPYDAFEKCYEAHYEVVNMLTDQLLVQLSLQVEIDEVHAYDKFMLRESIMSLIMRQKDVFHPMQDFTEEFIQDYGEPVKE
jgi:hypothetical protein